MLARSTSVRLAVSIVFGFVRIVNHADGHFGAAEGFDRDDRPVASPIK